MTSRAEIVDTHPDFPWLDADEPAAVEAFLHEQGWLAADETVKACGKAGEGNMNLTLRIVTDARSFILKQARPWVEKYDHIAAPWDRILYEQGFYERVRGIPAVADAMPRLLASDARARVLILEDLGASKDFTRLYAGTPLDRMDCTALAHYLAALHTETRGASDPEFVNRDMRLLNHEHIFVVPLAEENGLELDSFEPGLSQAAEVLRADSTFVTAVNETGERYLADGPCLLHGDYFPGSWLETRDGIRIIDPEFCYYGDPEFDVGVCLAHFRLAGLPSIDARAFLADYEASATPLQQRWLARYAGIEVMRRLLGVAQLPIAPSNGRRRALIEAARRGVNSGEIESLWQ